MNHHEAVDVLETIAEIYPKFEVTKKKAQMVLPQLKQMDYQLVMDKLSAYVAAHPFAPTIAEIAAYPPEKNDSLEKMKVWREESSKVPKEIKQRFHQQMLNLLMDKTNYDNSQH